MKLTLEDSGMGDKQINTPERRPNVVVRGGMFYVDGIEKGFSSRQEAFAASGRGHLQVGAVAPLAEVEPEAAAPAEAAPAEAAPAEAPDEEVTLSTKGKRKS
jgi:hypothetical protein